MVTTKKIVFGVTAAALLAAFSTGCSSDQPKSSASASPVASQSAAPEALAKASNTPIEATIHMHYFGNRVFDDNWPVFKKAAELTNVKLKGTASKASTNSDEVYNLMVAGGNLPDIIQFYDGKLKKLAEDGGLQPLDELIEKYAPHIKKYFTDNPLIKQAALNTDGKLYIIPYVQGGLVQKGWFVRKDWLDKLGLQQPKTVDELYTVLKAFKEKDPNGNGAADEVPYFNRDNRYGIYDLLSLWDTQMGLYSKDGKRVYGPLEPQFKTAVTTLAKWYKEGLIDKEIFTRGGKAREILLGDNKGGLTHDFFASTANYNTSLKSNVPGLNFVPIAPPASPTGVIKEYTVRSPYPNGATISWGISSHTKYSVELIKYFDFWFTEEGSRLMNFGVEGQTYTMVNGKPQLNADILTKPSVADELNKIGAQQQIGFAQDYENERQWTNEIALKGIDEYISKNYIVPPAPPVTTLSEQDRQTNSKLSGPLATYVEETLQKWVLGAEPIEPNYDKFVAKLKELGAEQIVAIMQAAANKK
ncbi:extracellular solute-binding protein [Paenibacillus sp. LjRoot56]|uniref:extracellular solute-binding protein n=1 Tax=Paenibacillus sp. LjRoot56 TaxID=3342333 RepID=UPI003ED09A65